MDAVATLEGVKLVFRSRIKDRAADRCKQLQCYAAEQAARAEAESLRCQAFEQFGVTTFNYVQNVDGQ